MSLSEPESQNNRKYISGIYNPKNPGKYKGKSIVDLSKTDFRYEANFKNKKGVYFYDDLVTPPFASFIDVPFSYYKALILSAVKWDSSVKDNGNVFHELQTLTHLMIYTENQCSGLIELIYKKPTRRSGTVYRNLDGTWHSNSFRDLLLDKTIPFLDNNAQLLPNVIGAKPFYKKDKFLSDVFIVRFSHDNTVKSGNIYAKTLYLNDVDIIINESLSDDNNK